MAIRTRLTLHHSGVTCAREHIVWSALLTVAFETGLRYNNTPCANFHLRATEAPATARAAVQRQLSGETAQAKGVAQTNVEIQGRRSKRRVNRVFAEEVMHDGDTFF